MQSDGTTGNYTDAHLICNLSLLDYNTIVEDLLFCKRVTGSAKAQAMFEILHKLITESAYVKAVMVLDQCLANMEEYRRLSEKLYPMLCGPIHRNAVA